VSKIVGRRQGLCALELAAMIACTEKHVHDTSKCKSQLQDFDKCMKAQRKGKGKGSSLLFHLSRITGTK
jgi:MarR-like DNA-binding transcriptional regulator SgrR of sgrS sRNA